MEKKRCLEKSKTFCRQALTHCLNGLATCTDFRKLEILVEECSVDMNQNVLGVRVRISDIAFDEHYLSTVNAYAENLAYYADKYIKTSTQQI